MSYTNARGRTENGLGSIRKKERERKDGSVYEYLFQCQKKKQLLMKNSKADWNPKNLVFTNKQGDVLSYRTVYDCFKRIVRKMGFPELRFHDLRHQYAVIAIKNGDDIKTIQGNLGHATAAFTLDVYGHVTEEMKRNRADRMESYMQALSEL